MSTLCFKAFGISIQSDIDLPSLKKTPPSADIKNTIVIKDTKVSIQGLESAKTVALHFQAAKNQLWLRVPGVARYLITNGDTISYQGEEGANPKTIALFITSTCMGAILHQRGLTVLHAAAVKSGDKAIVFCGPSGTGKSLLTAALHNKGYTIISDDLCVINDKGDVLPGYSGLKIWRDCFNVLGLSESNLSKVSPNIEKYHYPVKNVSNTPCSIKAIYIVGTNNHILTAEIQILTGMHKLMPLRSQIYRLQYLDGLGLMPSSTKRIMALAQNTPLSLLTRPSKFKIADYIAFIEKDLNSHPDK